MFGATGGPGEAGFVLSAFPEPLAGGRVGLGEGFSVGVVVVVESEIGLPDGANVAPHVREPVIRKLPVGAHSSVKLTNANIASIDFRMANNKHPDLMKFSEYEEIAFTYQKINWTWMDGGISAEDDWEAPVV